jgi:hypothetical protein
MDTLAIVVVSYNVRDLLQRCLQSIRASAAHAADRLAVTTVVVDNASQDGSAELVATEFPEVALIALESNFGFTGANNLAFRRLGFPVCAARAGQEAPAALAGGILDAPPDYVLLLNPDAEPQGAALGELVDAMRARPDAGACGARLQYGDGGFQHGAFRFPGLAQAALDLFPLEGVRGAHRLRDGTVNGRYPQALWDGAEPFPVDFVLGAALLLRGAAIRQIGGLDEGYWMYCEEMDWCRRARSGGWRAYAVPAARVVHHEGQSSRQRRWRSFEQLWRSRFRYFSIYQADYPPGFPAALRGLVRVGIARQRKVLSSSFARGEVDGVELADALAAFAAVENM